jgi:hypothetical protein
MDTVWRYIYIHTANTFCVGMDCGLGLVLDFAMILSSCCNYALVAAVELANAYSYLVCCFLLHVMGINDMHANDRSCLTCCPANVTWPQAMTDSPRIITHIFSTPYQFLLIPQKAVLRD